MYIISALEMGETTPLGVMRTLKVGKEWRNDEDGRRHSRKGKYQVYKKLYKSTEQKR